MSQLLEDIPLRQHLSQAGQLQAAKFTWPDVAAKLVSLYKKILTG
jgi:hypothetical protein